MATRARGKGRPKLTETAEIDRAIRDAALRVLLEQGEGATMHAVAMAAGLSRKSLYARYPNKTELFLQVIGELLQNVGGIVYDTRGSAEDRLLNYIEAALDVISRPESQVIQHLLTMDPTYIAALKSDMLGAVRKLFLEPLLALLEEAEQSGEMVIDDVGATARIIIRLIFTERMAAQHDAELLLSPTKQEDYVAFLVRLLTRGLTPRAS
jgi:AcrR family transcriptional regulator